MTPRKISFCLIALTFLGVIWLNLATPLLTVLFSLLLLNQLKFAKQRWIAVTLYLLLVAAVFYGFFFFVREAVHTLPQVAEEAIPIMINFAERHNFVLPFDDLASLKALARERLKEGLSYIAVFAQLASKEFVFLIIGLVVGISMFKNPAIDLGEGDYPLRNNLYSAVCRETARRFSTLYRSFATVMGAQLLISLVNTFCTSIFVLGLHIPHAPVVIAVTFVCGMIPIIGNIISNTVVCGIAITQSIQLAGIALLFLVLLHKVEYFLNSKIIGERIKNPMWLTLLSLIVGERIMGIPGMILAPVVLNYLKLETSQIDATVGTPEPLGH